MHLTKKGFYQLKAIIHTTLLIPCILILFCYKQGFTQQNPQFSQYLLNPYVINPGITGVEEYLEITASFRNQWTGFDGAPTTATFSFNTPLYLLKGELQRSESESHQGIGSFIYTDETGPVKQGGFFASYAYHLKISKDWFLSLGTFAGATQFKYDDSEAILLQNTVDPLVQSLSILNFDMSLGAYLYSDYLFFGLAANRLFNSEIPFDVQNGILTSDGSLERNFNLLIGSRISLSGQWEFVPSTLIMAVDGAPLQWELGAKLIYDNIFWGGFGYRGQDALIGIAGLRVSDSFLVSYSYDYSLSAFSGEQTGTHEIILSYRFDFGNQKCACPNYSL